MLGLSHWLQCCEMCDRTYYGPEVEPSLPADNSGLACQHSECMRVPVMGLLLCVVCAELDFDDEPMMHACNNCLLEVPPANNG